MSLLLYQCFWRITSSSPTQASCKDGEFGDLDQLFTHKSRLECGISSGFPFFFFCSNSLLLHGSTDRIGDAGVFWSVPLIDFPFMLKPIFSTRNCGWQACGCLCPCRLRPDLTHPWLWCHLISIRPSHTPRSRSRWRPIIDINSVSPFRLPPWHCAEDLYQFLYSLLPKHPKATQNGVFLNSFVRLMETSSSFSSFTPWRPWM